MSTPTPASTSSCARVTTGSSVVPLHEARAEEPWDFDVTAAFSVDGALDAAHEAALATAEEDFRFTLRPSGDPRPGCEVAEPADTEPAALAITDAQGHEADDAVVAEHAERTVKEHGFGLHLAGELRARVLEGGWSCWDRFEVEACLTTDLGEATAPGMGLDNNCARLPIAIARVPSDSDPSEKRYDPHAEEPDWDKGYDAGAGERSDYDFRVGALSSGGCDQSLLQQYTDKMERYFELDRSVKITNWYVMDYKRYLEHTGVGDNWDYNPYFLPANWFNAHIARSPWVGGLLYECTQRFEQTGVVGGDHDYCYWIRVINNDYEAYRRLRRYYLSDDGKAGDYVGFKKDPFKHTNNWFEYMCQGLHSGSVFAKYGANAPAIIKSWWDRWTNPDPIHAQYDVRQRPAETYPIGGTGGARCARNGFYMLHRYKVGDGGAVEFVDDDGAFFSEYLPRIREKAAAKAAADQIWNTLVSTCTSISAPAWSSETISQTRLAPALYPTKTVSFGAVNFGAEGGMLSDALVNKVTGDFVLTAGPQVRLWLDGTIAPELGGGLDVRLYDVFRAWVLGRFYNDVVSSYLSAGFHVLTFDLWKLKYKLPDQFNIPMPPPVEKEKERCRSFFYAPVPVGLELCIGVGGALGLKGDGPNDQATLKVEKVATTAGASGEKPGLVGKVIPYIAIKSSGSIGVDFFAGVAGFKLNLDPTVELQFPIEPSLHWSLKWQSATSKIAWELVPALRVGFDVVGFGGSLDFQLKWRFGDTKSWTIVDWDPLDLASMTLLEKSLTFSGETGF
ncbi:MAG: hypothetical protein U1F43_28615 [Myxococcota bacterium]